MRDELRPISGTSWAKVRLGLLAVIGVLVVLTPSTAQTPSIDRETTDPITKSLTRQLVDAALERTQHSVTYDGSYRRLDYPGGDVPNSIGVCTDVVVRSYRQLGIDLQPLVHEDMKKDFGAYPQLWNLQRPDPNIDHRRVPNLETFFRRHGQILPLSKKGSDFRPGDLVTWRLPGSGLPHIGIVTDQWTPDRSRPLIVHNIGRGPKLEDCLFSFEMVGHFRYGIEPNVGENTGP